VKTILAIPAYDEYEDFFFFAWLFDKNGCFWVKSAYKVYVSQRDGPQASSSDNDES
jgi:hypothetical protein